MSVEFTGEYIEKDGEKFPVVDVTKLDFSDALIGVKSKLTKVYRANGGEKITTRNENGEVESVLVANNGDAIFFNNTNDIYIPTDSNGNRFKYSQIESYGYSIQERTADYVVVRSNNKALLLVGCVDQKCAIKDAFGKGQSQFLYEGATIKKDIKTGNISGIDRKAFESTWIILLEEKHDF